MSSILGFFLSAFKKGLSGFSCKRRDPKAPFVFRLEPHELYSLGPQLFGFKPRLVTVLGFLLPSLIFTSVVLLLEAQLPLSFLFSRPWIRGVTLSQAILLGAIVFEAFRLFRATISQGPRYVIVSSALTLTLTLLVWPNSTILLACAFYAGLHYSLDRRFLRTEPFVLIASLMLVVVGAWGRHGSPLLS
jgi:chromate transport protein ChrA